MIDAKSILDVLMKGAQPQSRPIQGGGQEGGFGGLGDLLGKVLQGAPAQSQGQPGSTPGGFGGLGDLLGQLQKQMGAPSQASAPSPGAVPPGQGGLGGLGDILGQLQKQFGGSAGAPGAPGQPGGGLMEILAQVLAQATAGAKEGAGRLDDATGASSKARDAIGQATGKSPEDLLAQVQEWIRNNPGAAAAGAGGLGAVLLGTRTGRGVAGSAARLGALALIGGLAYKALENYREGRPLIGTDDPSRLVTEPAPSGTGFEPNAISNDTATLYIRSMIAAAASDGRIDPGEQRRILGALPNGGVGAEAHAFLEQEVQSPASIDELAAACRSPSEAVQVYTAARLALEPHSNEENEFLARLAGKLGIDTQLAAHIDATAHAAGT